MDCSNCGSEVKHGSSFCPFCGVQLVDLDPLDDIKHLVRITREETTALLARLDLIQARFESLELPDIVLEELAEAPETEAQAPAHIPEEPVTKEQTPEELILKEQISEEYDLEPSVVQETHPETTSLVKSRPGLMDRMFGSEAGRSKSTGLSEVQFGQKWLLILGIIIMVLGVGYFLKYSFDRNWIGPAGRVSMSYTVGLACLAGGELARRKLTHMFGLYLTGGGIAVLYFSTFAAFQIYSLLNHITAFGIMIMVTALACALSLFYDVMWLAVLGLIGGFLTPVILSTGVDNQAALMIYMVILNAGILTIAFFKRWPLLSHLGLVGTWVLFSGWYFKYYDESKFWLTILFLNIFFMIYAAVPFAYYFIRERTEKLTGFALTIPNSFIALGYSYVMIEAYLSKSAVSVATIGYTSVFAAMAGYLYRKHRENLEPFILLLAKALVFLVITVPLLLSANWITVFWAIQAAGILWAALRLKNKWLYGGGLALLAIAAGKFFIWDYNKVFILGGNLNFQLGYADLMIQRWLTTVVLLGGIYISARMIARSDRSMDLFGGNNGALIYTGFTVILFLALNVEVGAFFGDYMPDSRSAFITILWTLFAIGLFWTAWQAKNKWAYFACFGLLAAATIKFVAIDYLGVFNLGDRFMFDMGYEDLLFQRWLTSVGLLAAIFLLARVVRRLETFNIKVSQNDSTVLYVSFTLLLFVVLNVEVGAFFGDYLPQARFASTSVLWALFSIALMVLGFVKRLSIVRRVSLALFAVTVLKVFLVDMSNVSTPFRIISFIVLGTLLIGASFLYHKYKGHILPDEESVPELEMEEEAVL